jgi:hypothetical protein
MWKILQWSKRKPKKRIEEALNNFNELKNIIEENSNVK